MTIFFEQAKNMDINKVIDKSRLYILKWIDFIADAHKGENISILELGAGSCVTGLLASQILLSRNFQVNYLGVDYDIEKLNLLFSKSCELVFPNKKNISGLKTTVSKVDFDDPDQINQLGMFDIVIYDAAFHHIRNPSQHLKALQNILVPGGFAILQREQFLRPFFIGGRRQIQRLMESDEVQSGEYEMIYDRLQYIYLMSMHGFDLTFEKRSVIDLLLSRFSTAIFVNNTNQI